MTSFIIDISLIALFLVFIHIGFEAGLVRSFFAFCAGFVSILLAQNYPVQDGINYYLIFTVSAIVIYLGGLIIMHIVKFFYLSLFDKFAGIALSVLICFMLTVNFVLPQIKKQTNGTRTKVGSSIQQIYYKNILPIINKI